MFIPRKEVLILIVVEDGLVQNFEIIPNKLINVLILIVVEDGLVPMSQISVGRNGDGLNPYCSGRWSRTGNVSVRFTTDKSVLILIVVEDGLVQINVRNVPE